MRILLHFVTVFVLVFMVSACNADEAAVNARNSLRTAQITYTAGMTAAADMHQHGVLTDAQWGQVKDAAVLFVDAYMPAVTALDLYVTHQSQESKESLRVRLLAMRDSLSRLVEELVTLGVDIKQKV